MPKYPKYDGFKQHFRMSARDSPRDADRKDVTSPYNSVKGNPEKDCEDADFDPCYGSYEEILRFNGKEASTSPKDNPNSNASRDMFGGVAPQRPGQPMNPADAMGHSGNKAGSVKPHR